MRHESNKESSECEERSDCEVSASDSESIYLRFLNISHLEYR
jgi:hypothetical protein